MERSNWIDTGRIVTFTCGHTQPIRINKYWTRKNKEESLARDTFEFPCLDCRRARHSRPALTAEERRMMAAVNEWHQMSDSQLARIALDPAGVLAEHTDRAGMPFDLPPEFMCIFSDLARGILRERKRLPVAA